jgi:hypothetical protein
MFRRNITLPSSESKGKPCKKSAESGSKHYNTEDRIFHSYLKYSILILFSHLCLSLPSCLFHSGFSDQNFVRIYLPSHVCYMPRPTHPLWFDHTNIIMVGAEVMKLLLCTFLQFSVISCRYVRLFPHSQLPFSEHVQNYMLPSMQRHELRSPKLILATMGSSNGKQSFSVAKAFRA